MTGTLQAIVRHPVKSIGREELAEVTLAAGAWLPFDRLWAVAHERSKLDGGWARKVNFLRGVSAPSLMAVEARLDEATGRIAFRHPNAGEVSARPDREDEAAALIDWLRALWPDDMPRPTHLYRAQGAHLSDVPDAWVSINSTASLTALSQRAGVALDRHRFRGNLWLDGLAPWQEFEWVGRTIRIGEVDLAIRAEITRCKATMANPTTGRRDVDTLDVLSELGHQEFGVYAEVIAPGTLRLGDPVSA